MDFFPTMLELAGLPAMAEKHAGGVSLAPLLRGGKTLPPWQRKLGAKMPERRDPHRQAGSPRTSLHAFHHGFTAGVCQFSNQEYWSAHRRQGEVRPPFAFGGQGC